MVNPFFIRVRIWTFGCGYLDRPVHQLPPYFLPVQDEPSCDFLKWGEAGDWSDHVAFKDLGIPIAYFEMMNWDIEPCEGEETENYGWIMHTCMDNLSMVSHEKLEMTAEVVAALAFQISKNKLPKSEKGKVAKGNKYISIQKRNDLPN